MIEYVNGDIFEIEADWRVNPVNCEGVAGAGLAERFKHRFPRAHQHYASYCAANPIGLRPGVVFVSSEGVLHFSTKDRWLDPSRLGWIHTGLQQLERILSVGPLSNAPCTIAIPWLGCGLGGLNKSQVGPLFYRHLDPLSDTHTIKVITEER